MSFFDKVDRCNCGHEFKKKEIICPTCGRTKYKMSYLPKQEDSIESTIRRVRKAREFAKKISFFQIRRATQ